MATHLYIITGASRGMGLCLARQLLGQSHRLLCISRTLSTDLTNTARQLDADLTQWSIDLADPLPVTARLGHWLAEQDPHDVTGATLINNAGVLPPIAPLRDSDPAELARALRVGLEAPLLLTNSFLASTRHWTASRKVLNISSGLGRRPMASQSAYCAAKAGLDHFTRCLALDEALIPNGAKVCSLAPGVIDTGMQLQLRSAAPERFPDQAGFADLKQTNQLTPAHDAATRVLDYLNRPDFGSQPVADVRL
ncbi:SDR family NAD(P)-dependent oxidoreductase [Rhodoferax sp.]|uniref:SDR family NAD(P)-dependent oxidoreductase n=1 Tax=Rhodoferax sp. TaxID=50421 RepID=UPI00261A8758|nr:SDR family NAD(P)-dependent oxidoreductase [Rhodoferax sp.]MDD2925004.1 SDR family NAD(P)-dependent oxidoreductase [Rhodoferax sp.]